MTDTYDLNVEQSKFRIEVLDASGAHWIKLCTKSWTGKGFSYSDLSFNTLDEAVKRTEVEDELCRIVEYRNIYLLTKKVETKDHG